MDMVKKQKKQEMGQWKRPNLTREEAGQVVACRALIILLADILIGTGLDYVRASANREYKFVFEVCPWLVYVMGALALAALGYFAYTLVKKVDVRRYVMTPAMIFALALYLFGIVLLYKMLTMVMILSVMVIASVLFILYYIYTILLY